MAKFENQEMNNELKIIKSNTSLRGSEMGFITMKGTPGVRYTITTSYKKGNLTVPVTQWRVADEDGLVTFNWVVDSKTAPGTYSALISGGGKELRMNHIVLPK